MGRKKRSALIVVAWMSFGGGLLLRSAGCAAHDPASIVPLSALYADCRTATTSTTVDGFNADLFWNDSSAPQKAVILLGGSEGGKGWSQDRPRVQQLVDEGYFVISLAYFAADGLPSHLRRIPLEYFAGVFDWLAARKGIVPNNCAIIGASRGAELALLLAGRYPQITCVVALAPSAVVFPGPPTSLWDALAGQHSAWACDGQEVPFVPMPVFVHHSEGSTHRPADKNVREGSLECSGRACRSPSGGEGARASAPGVFHARPDLALHRDGGADYGSPRRHRFPVPASAHRL